ncbi:MAG: hypothetical protein ACJ8FU_25370, partial [Xanthobacteraceae bacterium]
RSAVAKTIHCQNLLSQQQGLSMRVPKEFDQFCRYFLEHQAFADLYDHSYEKLIEDAVASLNRQQALVVKQFLNELLSGRYSGADLVGIWRRTPAQMNLGDAKGTVARLKMMRDALSERLGETSKA